MYVITVAVGSIRADEWLALIGTIFARHGFGGFTGSDKFDLSEGGLEAIGIANNVGERYGIYSEPDNSLGTVWGALGDLRSEPWVREALRHAELLKVIERHGHLHVESQYDVTEFVRLPCSEWTRDSNQEVIGIVSPDAH